MGEMIDVDIQAAYDLREAWKIKDAISGLVIETDGASKFMHTATAAEIGLDQKLAPPQLFSLVALLSTFLSGTRFYSRYSA
jgi:hypothetical protein